MKPAQSLPAVREGVCYAQGSRYGIKAEMRRQEARGDVQVAWGLVTEPYPGVVVIPYVRLRSLREVRRRAFVRIGGAAVLAAGAVGGLAALLWQARFLIMGAAGVALLFWAGWIITRLIGHQPGCVGLHCPGCKG